jgi:predicted membrane channel-forming protein YqfA (hemolysin III family)
MGMLTWMYTTTVAGDQLSIVNIGARSTRFGVKSFLVVIWLLALLGVFLNLSVR